VNQVDYKLLVNQADAITADEPDLIANLSNISALIFDQLEQINWAGFYLNRDEQLVLGPFQGKVACVRIELGKGVCGTAAAKRKTQLVDDVHAFPGHIACDSASNSEIVVPIIVNDQVMGVLDIDSPEFNRFTDADKEGMENLVTSVIEQLNWSDFD